MKWRISINSSYVATADTFQEAVDYTRGGRCEIGVVTITTVFPDGWEMACVGSNSPGSPDLWAIRTRPHKKDRQ